MEFKSAYLDDTEIVKAYKGDTLFYEKGGYTAINWIGSDSVNGSFGRFVIPVSFDNTKTLRVVAEIPNKDTQNGLFFYDNNNNRYGGLHLIQNNGRISFLYGNTWQSSGIEPVVDTVYDLKMSSSGGYVDNVKKTNGATVSWGNNMFITNSYLNTDRWFGTYHKYHLIQVYDENDNLELDCIPCLDKNNKPCLYDTISRMAYYSTNATDFIYG